MSLNLHKSSRELTDPRRVDQRCGFLTRQLSRYPGTIYSISFLSAAASFVGFALSFTSVVFWPLTVLLAGASVFGFWLTQRALRWDGFGDYSKKVQARSQTRHARYLGRKLDRKYGWRPRLGAPHPKRRHDTFDRCCVRVQDTATGFQVFSEHWIYENDTWKPSIRQAVQEFTAGEEGEAALIDYRSDLVIRAEAANAEAEKTWLALRSDKACSSADPSKSEARRQRQLLAENLST